MVKARAILGLGLLLAVGMTRTVGASTWQVDDRGNCDRVWEASDLLRGPRALLMTPPAARMAVAHVRYPTGYRAAILSHRSQSST